MQKAIVKNNFYKSFGEQKIDIVVLTSQDDPFWQVIKDQKVKEHQHFLLQCISTTGKYDGSPHRT